MAIHSLRTATLVVRGNISAVAVERGVSPVHSRRPRALRCGRITECYDLPSAAMRWASRETLRRAALRCTTFFCAERIMTGSASAIAATARDRSPAVNASSTLRTTVRRRERRALLTTVRRTLCRAAFLADFVLAMVLLELREARLIGVRRGSVNACAGRRTRLTGRAGGQWKPARRLPRRARSAGR